MAIMQTMNLSRVLRLIWMNPGISRIEIARALDLDKSTITNITSRLIAQQLIITLEEGEVGAKGGRKPVGLAIDSTFGMIVGLEMTTDRIMAAGMDLRGNVLFMQQIALERDSEPLEQVFLKAMEVLGPAIAQTGIPLIGIGIGLSGLIDPVEGVIIKSIPLDIAAPYPLLDRIQPLVDVPIFIDNDANCCCWEEMVTSGRDRYDNFIFVLAEDRFHSVNRDSSRMGFAVGFGLVIHGEVLRGADYAAGEFQSILWKPGNTSQFSISDEIMAEIEKHPQAIEKTIHELASHVAFLTNVLDLSRVVIGGGLVRYGDSPLAIFSSEIEKNWSYPNQVNCEICMVHDGEYAVAIGAAAMYLERMFTLPAISAENTEDGTEQLQGYEMFQHLREVIRG
jgi:predicted NBD/HSP70 family sugar kinase